MTFKENLLKKIEVDKLSKKVMASMGPPDSGRRINRELMRELLEMGTRSQKKERDLELYILETEAEDSNILVLDNELPIYNTTVEDVVLRRSPVIKEMLNIRNAIKILNDSDVRVSKKDESVRAIQKECIDLLDLSFDESDIEVIENDGAASLESGYAEGVSESLSLFAELLNYSPPPKAFGIANHQIIGELKEGKVGEWLFGPLVMHSLIDNSAKLINERISSFDKKKTAFIRQVSSGKEKASQEGKDVFGFLRKEVMERMRAGVIDLK